MTDSLSSESDLDPDATDRREQPFIAAPRAGILADGSESTDLDVPADDSAESNPSPASSADGEIGPPPSTSSSPVDADQLLDSLFGDGDDPAQPVSDSPPPTPPPSFEIPSDVDPEPAAGGVSSHDGSISDAELASFPPPSLPVEDDPLADDGPPVEAPSDDDPAVATQTPHERLAARATTPELGRLELRQIAGLTSGTTMSLDVECYDFAQEDGVVGFQLEVDRNDRAVVIPHTAETRIDTVEVHEPTVIGLGVLDVGNARFLVRHRRERKRATDWLDLHDAADRPEPLIEVPENLGRGLQAPTKPRRTKRLRGLRRNRGDDDTVANRPNLDAVSWDFIERIRAIRIELTDRERYLHPDPAELADRAKQQAPILSIRPPGHPLFAKVAVIAADMPWRPKFDRIAAIPEGLGPYLKPLMSLPSRPIAADLMIGPLGIVGHPSATMACARHVITSLYGMSTSDLRLHIATVEERHDLWDWAYELAPPGPVDTEHTFPVVVVDGMGSFPTSGLTHADAIEHRAGAVVLADSVDDLPSYCGTVLQVDEVGSGLLTNHLGQIIAGTPIGVSLALAAQVADDLVAVRERRERHRRWATDG